MLMPTVENSSGSSGNTDQPTFVGEVPFSDPRFTLKIAEVFNLSPERT